MLKLKLAIVLTVFLAAGLCALQSGPAENGINLIEESGHHPNLDEPWKYQEMLVHKILKNSKSN